MPGTNAAQSTELNERLYAGYDAWKGWSDPFTYTPEEASYYAAETSGKPLHGTRVLEIGFGNGGFLAWARDQGAEIHGSEITPGAITAAKAAGIPLVPGDFEASGGLAAESFDLIVAFDVFEHLDPPTIIAKLHAITLSLKPGGWLVLRFPNGQSPFGLAPQNADATHVVALSQAKVEQYAMNTGLNTVRYAGAARSGSGSLARDVFRRVRWFLRDLHMAGIRYLYATDVELEPVVTLVLERPIHTSGIKKL